VNVVGVDEAGRGPIAGPVMTAAVLILPPQFHVLLSEGLNDSKKISQRGRERLFSRINELGVRWSAQAASHRRIDSTDILRATLWAMERAVMKLDAEPDIVVVDGNIQIPGIRCGRQIALPRADAKVPAVMAASIVAKVLRDRVMRSLHKIYPGYGFDSHKGYPTSSHRLALDILGPSPVHRLSFGGYNKGAVR
jgi:ribonuclease HII